MERILLVEDDESIKRELTMLLRANGYMVVDEPPCDLTLLDINLPDRSGYDICAELRRESNVPVVFLTAREGTEDEILAFGVGADDFIRKPYNSSVLLARIARLLRRRSSNVVENKGLHLDLASMTLGYGGETIGLTKNEARILWCLMNNELCAKEDIIEDLWNSSLYVDENTLYVIDGDDVNIMHKLAELISRVEGKDDFKGYDHDYDDIDRYILSTVSEPIR